MKTKLVVWGSNAQEEKVLIALELLTDSSEVNVYTFPASVATEDFYKVMMEEWRVDKPVAFPAGYTTQVSPLSITERLLPEGLKADKEDLIVRAQTEWHFIVLSDKLNQSYKAELEELRDRIEKLSTYDAGLWEELKGFWSKVQAQLRDRNLFREHADMLREMTNALFAEMKQLRTKMDEEFKQKSEAHRAQFMEQLAQIEAKISKDERLRGVFDELKKMQTALNKARLTKEHRNRVWERLDAAFKNVKEKRFGPDAGNDRSPLERLQKRYKGLLSAINKMESSVKRDEDELKFQRRKIERTDGQLEAQIRQAKLAMIEERIRSKGEKLTDMLKIKGELEQKLEALAKKEAARQQKEQEAQARQAAEKKKNHQTSAASTPKENFLSAAALTLGEAFGDVVDTARAIAEVVENKLESTVQEVLIKAKEVGDELKEDFKEASAKLEDADDSSER